MMTNIQEKNCDHELTDNGLFEVHCSKCDLHIDATPSQAVIDAAKQMAFENGGTEGGGYQLEDEDLEQILDTAISTSIIERELSRPAPAASPIYGDPNVQSLVWIIHDEDGTPAITDSWGVAKNADNKLISLIDRQHYDNIWRECLKQQKQIEAAQASLASLSSLLIERIGDQGQSSMAETLDLIAIEVKSLEKARRNFEEVKRALSGLDDNQTTMASGAARLLVSFCIDSKSAKVEIAQEGVTYGGKECGDWQITVSQVKAASEEA